MEDMLSEEVARDQLQSFYDYYDIHLEDAEGEHKKALYNAEKRLIRAIRKGRITFEGVKVVQTTATEKRIEYSELTGKNKLQVKGTDEENYQKMYSLLGSLSGLGQNGIASLRGIDLSVAECLGSLFLYV